MAQSVSHLCRASHKGLVQTCSDQMPRRAVERSAFILHFGRQTSQSSSLKGGSSGHHFAAQRGRAHRLYASVAAPPAYDVPELEEEEPALKESNFRWASNWYGVAVPQDMDKSVPTPLTVLGIPMVLWYNRNQEKWTCFLDQCPHRLAPLSEGRVDENGDLQCSYHGWSFKGNGGCTCIPQAAKEGPEARACASERARVRSFPLKESHGLLFVWPDAQGADEAERTPLPVLEDMYTEGANISAIARDLEYNYEMLAENVTDPSHLPFSHHGLGPLRRSQGKPLPLTLQSKGVEGFTGNSDGYIFTPTMKSTVEFKAPQRFHYYRQIERDGKQIESYTTLYLTPTVPGKSRLLLVEAFNFKLPWFFKYLRPRWLAHLQSQDVLDGDASLLHWQQLQYARSGASPEDFNKVYFMPTTADRFVVGFRRWLSKFGQGRVQYAAGTDSRLSDEALPKERVLSRLEGHTKHCTTCQKALRQIKALRTGLGVTSLSLGTAAAVLGSTDALTVRAVLVVAALLMAGGAWKLGDLVQLFIFRGYNHHEVGAEKPPVIFSRV